MTGPSVEKRAVPTLIVLTGNDRNETMWLASEIAQELADNMNRLTGKFSAQQWQAYVTEGNGMNMDELLDSTDAVFSRHNLMIMTGFEDNEDWNGALAEIHDKYSPASTLLIHGGKDDIRDVAHFQSFGFIDPRSPPENQMKQAMDLIREARGHKNHPAAWKTDENGHTQEAILLNVPA